MKKAKAYPCTELGFLSSWILLAFICMHCFPPDQALESDMLL